MINRKSELDTQLRTFDDQAATRFDSAEFIDEGMVLRGTVFLTYLRSPETSFERALGEDMYTAFQSWIPGGRIDQFRWSWTWYQDGTPGNMKNKDMFLLRRPEIRRCFRTRRRGTRRPRSSSTSSPWRRKRGGRA